MQFETNTSQDIPVTPHSICYVCFVKHVIFIEPPPGYQFNGQPIQSIKYYNISRDRNYITTLEGYNCDVSTSKGLHVVLSRAIKWQGGKVSFVHWTPDDYFVVDLSNGSLAISEKTECLRSYVVHCGRLWTSLLYKPIHDQPSYHLPILCLV